MRGLNGILLSDCISLSEFSDTTSRSILESTKLFHVCSVLLTATKYILYPTLIYVAHHPCSLDMLALDIIHISITLVWYILQIYTDRV
jgi:hypothetical protein